ncbi:TVG0976779 [Thermoplasma volcanium GSS1]|uniref:TVG0976779 protein n=1 Tax=Thermoplasma volcanium (strain ATCC 51530 / DSM 4299 / JCM 9571 / NBRC 15438 / GSS1) TaxID=273116 RepID=Q97A58_THEVO|nr:hypothetical protein [Thermoplasma volcanium]BAB60094.1 TVG0976779 [Thermoplasma volcanium GSS1]
MYKKTLFLSILALVAVVLLVYGMIPPISSTPVSEMKEGHSYYIYGEIVYELQSTNRSIFVLYAYGQNITVVYSGPIPAAGSFVLVHGTYKVSLLLQYINADSVYRWYYSL